MVDINIFVDMYVSTKDDRIKPSVSNKHMNVCLNISSFIFSFLLSFIIDLYNLIPLIANAKRIGINIMFCKHKEDIINIVPLFTPRVAIIEDIV